MSSVNINNNSTGYQRSSRYYLEQQEQQYSAPEIVEEVLAHYRIQLQKEIRNLQATENYYKRKFDELEERRAESREHEKRSGEGSRNHERTVSYKMEEEFELELAQRKKEREYLTKKLGSLKRHPSLLLNGVDELLIPHQDPMKLIQEKQKEIRQLQNELIQAENIFQGKYVIEHKLINQYETQLALNKRLKQEKEENQSVKEKLVKMNKKRVKNGVVQGEYRKECEKISREVEEMKRKIKQMSSGGTNAYAEQNIHHIQPLQLESLKEQLKEHMKHNEELNERFKEKRHQLQLLIKQSEVRQRERQQSLREGKGIIARLMEKDNADSQQKINKQENSMERTRRRIMGRLDPKRQEQETEFERTVRRDMTMQEERREAGQYNKQKAQVKQQSMDKTQQEKEGLLDSVIRFFQGQTKKKQAINRNELGDSQNIIKAEPTYSNLNNRRGEPEDQNISKGRELHVQGSNSPTMSKLNMSPEQRSPERSNGHVSFLLPSNQMLPTDSFNRQSRPQESQANTDRLQSTRTNSKYDRFGLGEIYKKNQ